MKLLAVGRARKGADVRAEIARLAEAEMRALWALYRDGVVREMYSPGGPGAILVLEAASAQEAEVALAALPLAAGSVIEFEIIELHPFSALAVLFAAQPEQGAERENDPS